MIDQTNMKQTAETVVTMSNAAPTSLPAYRSATPARSSTQLRNRAFWGTLRLDRRPKTLGASPSFARPKTMREVEYIPELAEDMAEVSTTRFTTMAAIPSPASENMPMNGLWPALNSVHGVTDIRMMRAPT